MRIDLLAVTTLISLFVGANAVALSKGEQVYVDKKCSLCHEIDGMGGKFGGDLSHVGFKRDAAWLKRFMRDPKTLKPGAMMQPFTGTDGELEALVDYLASLK